MTTNPITLSLFEFGQLTTPTPSLTGTLPIEVHKLHKEAVELSVDDMFAHLDSSDPRAAAAVEAGTKWVAETFFAGQKKSLATLRMSAGLTQRSLANRLGVSQPMVAKWEKGDGSSMQLKTVVSLAAALSITVDELVNALTDFDKE